MAGMAGAQGVLVPLLVLLSLVSPGFALWGRTLFSGFNGYRLSNSGAPAVGASVSESNEPVGPPFDSCRKCPKSLVSRHSGYIGYAHWTTKPGAANLLPTSYCPPRSKRALAREAVASLVAAGYTKTASLLESSGILMNLTAPATILAPSDEAYLAGNLPPYIVRLVEGRGKDALHGRELFVRNFMRNHLLEEFLPFAHLLAQPEGYLKTLLPGSEVKANAFTGEDLDFVRIQPISNTLVAREALVVRRDLFCNGLVIVHGVSQVLLPPPRHIPGWTPPAPTHLDMGAHTALTEAL